MPLLSCPVPLCECENGHCTTYPGMVEYPRSSAGHGLAAAAMLATQLPSCRVVMLATFGRAGYLRRAMEAGAAGFVVKDVPPDVLAGTSRRVMSGERVIDPALAAATLAAGESPLTSRERDVLIASRSGASVADIASRLYLSEGTVRNYLSAAISKTAARNHSEALRVADDLGWLEAASLLKPQSYDRML